MMRFISVLLFLVATVCSCGSTSPGGGVDGGGVDGGGVDSSDVVIESPEFVTAKIVRRYAHNEQSYTQGLLFDRGKLYESTGQYGQSKLMINDIATGRSERQVSLQDIYFGEGLALLDDRLYQLTWREGVCLVYDRATLKLVDRHRYHGEGWGVVAHQGRLLVSDGSSTIRIYDPKSWAMLGRVEVRDDRGAVGMLNEMEMVDSMLYVNIYMSPIVAVIDPVTGIVAKYIDCSSLVSAVGNGPNADVLNGIAFDSLDRRLYLTGKLWDTLFEIEIP